MLDEGKGGDGHGKEVDGHESDDEHSSRRVKKKHSKKHGDHHGDDHGDHHHKKHGDHHHKKHDDHGDHHHKKHGDHVDHHKKHGDHDDHHHRKHSVGGDHHKHDKHGSRRSSNAHTPHKEKPEHNAPPPLRSSININDCHVAEEISGKYGDLLALLQTSYSSAGQGTVGPGEELLNCICAGLRKKFGETPSVKPGKKKINLNAGKHHPAHTPGGKHVDEEYTVGKEFSTIRAELFPFYQIPPPPSALGSYQAALPAASTATFGSGSAIYSGIGMEEAMYWIQWAMLITDGAGYGFMTSSSLTTTLQQPLVAGNCTVDFVREVYSKVKKVREDLNTTNVVLGMDGKNIAALPNPDAYVTWTAPQLALNLLLTILCAKFSIQLDVMNDTVLAYIREIGKYAALLQEPSYMALSIRYQLDHEEWSISKKDLLAQLSGHAGEANPNSKNVQKKLIDGLQHKLSLTKQYVELVEDASICDIYLKRDALKRLANCYMEVHCRCHPQGNMRHKAVVHGSKMPPLPLTAKRKKRLTKNGETGFVRMKGTEMERVQIVAAELKGMKEADISLKESTDSSWLIKIAHHRAEHVMARIKAVSMMALPPIQHPPNLDTNILHDLVV